MSSNRALLRTRAGRNNRIQGMDDEIDSLREGLINKEVIDMAIDLHAAMVVISNKYSSEAVIDFIPLMTSLLNRYDASLKVNSDLTNLLNDLSFEKESLIEKLRMERERKNMIVEDSLSNEKQADSEICALKFKIKDMEDEIRLLQVEMTSKDEIIKLLEADSRRISAMFNSEEINFSAGLRLDSEKSFITPRSSSKVVHVSPPNSLSTRNRFSPLDSDESLSSPLKPRQRIFRVRAQVHRSTSTSPNKVKYNLHKKGKVIILSDSQGREMYKHLNGLDDFDVFVHCLPGAKMKHVIERGMCFIKDLEQSDYVIIMAGSNDFGEFEPGLLTVMQGLDLIEAADINTNILVCAIPFRYDLPFLNDDICFTNSAIQNRLINYKGKSTMNFSDVSSSLMRSHFTKKGLHYKNSAKRVLGKVVSEYVNDSCKQTVSDCSLTIVTKCDITQTTQPKIPIKPDYYSPIIRHLECCPVTPVDPTYSPVPCCVLPLMAQSPEKHLVIK